MFLKVFILFTISFSLIYFQEKTMNIPKATLKHSMKFAQTKHNWNKGVLDH